LKQNILEPDDKEQLLYRTLQYISCMYITDQGC